MKKVARSLREKIEGAFLNRDFFLFNLGMIASALAGEIFRMAFAFWMLRYSGSTLEFGIALTAMSACQITARLLIGWIGDKYSPLSVIRGSLAVQSILACVLGFMAHQGLGFNATIPILLGAFGLCMGSRDPLSSAAVTTLVPTKLVTKAMGQRGAISSAMSLVGPVVGGVAIAAMDASSAIFLSSLGIVCAFFTLQTISTLTGQNESTNMSGHNFKNFVSEWMAQTWIGIKVFVKVRADFLLCLVTCLINFVLAPLFFIVIPHLVVKAYQLPGGYIGIFDFCFAAGMVLGGMRVVNYLNLHVGKLHAIAIGLSGLAIPFFAFSFFSSPFILGLGMFLSGLGMLNLFSNVSALRAIASPSKFRSRMFATAAFLVAISIPPGIATASLTVGNFDHTIYLLGCGLLVLLAASSIYAIPQLKELMSMSDEEAEGAYQRLYPKAYV